MGIRRLIQSWPVYRQLTDTDPLGRGKAAESPEHVSLTARTAHSDRVARSVCPYCAVGCGQMVYVQDEKVIQIEGDPHSPISRGRLCPKGSASKQLVTGPHREHKVHYRAPYATEWRELDLETAMDMVAKRVLDARRKGWQDTDEHGNPLRRTMGLASLGGATLDNEEKLSDQEAVHCAGCAANREPGPYLTLRHGSRSGNILRSRRGNGLPAGSPQL